MNEGIYHKTFEDPLVAGITIITLIVVFVICIAVYILRAWALQRIMKARGMTALYRAWIPFWNSYTYGKIIENEVPKSSYVKENFTCWILTFYGLAGYIPVIGSILSLAGYIYTIIVSAVLAKKYSTMPSMIITSIFGVPFIGLFILGNSMKKNKVEMCQDDITCIRAVESKKNAMSDTVVFEQQNITKPDIEEKVVETAKDMK